MKYDRKYIYHPQVGQSLVEFALILPLFVLIVVGIFDLGRAFFAFIDISNAAREGVRVYTFAPDDSSIAIINHAIDKELGASSVVSPANIVSTEIRCVNPATNNMELVTTDLQLRACKSEAPIRVTVTYSHALILSFFFTQPLTLVRSAEMMVP